MTILANMAKLCYLRRRVCVVAEQAALRLRRCVGLSIATICGNVMKYSAVHAAPCKEHSSRLGSNSLSQQACMQART